MKPKPYINAFANDLRAPGEVMNDCSFGGTVDDDPPAPFSPNPI